MSNQTNKRFLYWFLGTFLLVSTWYIYAADYSYRAISGTYVLKQPSTTYTLRLDQDKSFIETVKTQRNEQSTKGMWRRLGEGGVVFEGDFILPDGVAKSQSGTVYAEANKSYTLRPSLDFSNESARFYKRLFR